MWVVEGVETSDWRRTDVSGPIASHGNTVCFGAGCISLGVCLGRGVCVCVCVNVCVCVCVRTLGLNSVQHFSSGNTGPLMESRCRAQGKRMRLGAARGTPSRRRLEAGRGGQAERDLSRKAPD